ncbi:class I SAM-dependent methyltransferase [Bermanella marisrubri]|uniref:Ribosomal RNA small subunit methyltransferase J n=1 Tax=Bermanella marisrubri TaxID=207949 RepID=Q1MXN8_9GAMM|nr:class I SAM-dependent methyltransferase [Bermanella marisrubri]EAT10746.1 hypothetical protein RED65_03865 [Oceanobacter sp. RED65] [Bermanella marisrubri]QIZ83607.1 class I SAM-dependent methyltransferase [Bermanella marisrubri]
MQYPIGVICADDTLIKTAKEYANELNIGVFQRPNQDGLYLFYDMDGLALKQVTKKPMGELRIDFADGGLTWRRNHGGGNGQAIAKAIGVKQKARLSVLDATAGTATDSFILAALGCNVTMIERHPVVALLLQDGLERAGLNTDVRDITQRMSLFKGDALDSLSQLQESFDVVYLDPMFPHSEKKSAQVKKSMQYFRDMVGKDEDADGLLEPALDLARYRVVVKRPRKSPFLSNRQPTISHEGKANRFDIYVIQSMKDTE